MNNKLFYNFLREKGFTETGAKETIKRIEENKPDRVDIYQLRDFETTKNS